MKKKLSIKIQLIQTYMTSLSSKSQPPSGKSPKTSFGFSTRVHLCMYTLWFYFDKLINYGNKQLQNNQKMLKENISFSIIKMYQKFDICVEGIVQRIIAVKSEDSEVDVRTTKCGLQHGEADADSFKLQCVSLFLRYTD